MQEVRGGGGRAAAAAMPGVEQFWNTGSGASPAPLRTLRAVGMEPNFLYYGDHLDVLRRHVARLRRALLVSRRNGRVPTPCIG